MAATMKLGTRAVLRLVQTGMDNICTGCHRSITWRAATQRREVICNVYKRGHWDRVEHFHADCYVAAGEPHGPADASKVTHGR